MREISFRGKRKDNGEWVYGSCCVDCFEKTSIPSIQENITGNIYHISSETVGQYTGLTDKNGTKIFEGDILKLFDDEMLVVLWTELFNTLALKVYVEYTEKKRGKEIKETRIGWAMLIDYSLSDAEVIGNIHDNPELLGGESK